MDLEKEYFENGNIKFEGEYLKGKKWMGKGCNTYSGLDFKINNGKGNVKEYNDNDNDNLIFKG